MTSESELMGGGGGGALSGLSGGKMPEHGSSEHHRTSGRFKGAM